MADPYAPGSKEWWLVRQVANGDERRSWYELTDEDRAALVAPAALTALAAMDGAFVTSRSVSNLGTGKRAASVSIEFWGEGSLARARAAEDALQAALTPKGAEHG